MCKEYKLPLLWSCESRIDVINEEIIDLMAESNCYALQVGVESGNQEVLKSIKKNIRLDHLEHIVAYASKYYMEIFLGFMLGHYSDTLETMQDTIDFLKKMIKINPHVRFSVSVNTPFPGTWQYEHAEEIGLEIIDYDYSHYDLMTPVIRTANFNEELLIKLFKEANTASIQSRA